MAADCEVVATCVPGPVEMEQVCLGPAGIAERLKAGALYIDHTSNSPALVRRVHAMLYAPVSGGMEDAQTRPAGHGQRRAGPPLSARDIRTFAGTSGNDEDALIPVIATSARQWRCRGTWSRRAAIERPAALSPNGYGAAIIRYRAAILDRPQSVRPERSWERF